MILVSTLMNNFEVEAHWGPLCFSGPDNGAIYDQKCKVSLDNWDNNPNDHPLIPQLQRQQSYYICFCFVLFYYYDKSGQCVKYSIKALSKPLMLSE